MESETKTLEERAQEAVDNGERVSLPMAMTLLKGVRDHLFKGEGKDEVPIYTFSKEADKSLIRAATCIMESGSRMSYSARQLYDHYPPGSKAWDVAGVLEGEMPSNDPTSQG